MNYAASSDATSHATRPVENAQVVLDQTRRELLDFLVGEPAVAKADKSRKARVSALDRDINSASAPKRSSNARNDVDSIDWMGLVKAGAAIWWRDHPLHLGATVLRPVLSDFVRRKPVATLATAAAAGAALVLFRPWRIASVTALAMSLVRSSNLPVMAASLVATVAENLKKEQA